MKLRASKVSKLRSAFTLQLESLESREMLAFDAFAQLSLELVNRARVNPAAEVARNSDVANLNSGLAAGTINAAAKQPLAPNALLEQAAKRHNDDMKNNEFFSHTGSDSSTAGQRLVDTGYVMTTRAENLAAVPYYHGTLNNLSPNSGVPDGSSPTTKAEAVQDLHDILFASSGHRKNMMNPAFRELGVHVHEFNGPWLSFPALKTGLTTEVYAAKSSVPILTGVVINDTDSDDFYDVGEGISGVTVAAYQAGTLVGQTTSISTGGYALPLAAGTYDVHATGGGVTRVRTVTIGTVNVKQDFEAGSDPGGVFQGRVFADSNENGSQTTGELGLSGWTVFIDANGNAQHDGGEVSATTNASGDFSLTTATSGTYTVMAQSPFGFRLSSGGVASHTSAISVGQTIGGMNFARYQDVQLAGTVAHIYGTPGDDAISFTAATAHVISVNGADYSVAPSAFNTFHVYGRDAADSIVINANDGNDTVTIDPGELNLAGVTTAANGTEYGYTLRAISFSNVDVDLGGGVLDRANLNGGAGNEDLFAHPSSSRLQGSGFVHDVENYEELYAEGGAGGNDRVYVNDGPSNDHYIGRKEFSVLKGADGEFFVRMDGFERNFAYSSGVGTDYAFFYDSPGNDNFFGVPEYAVMQDPAVTYFNYAAGFTRAFAYATQGGFDQAFLTAGAGDDAYFGKENLASLRGANFEYFNQAEMFERTYAYGGQGGNDIAYYYGSAGNDHYVAYESSSVWRGPSDIFYHTVNDFVTNVVFASQGGTDQAVLFDGGGNDVFFGRDDDSYLSRTGYITRIINVEQVEINGVNGPTNTLNVDSLDYALSTVGTWVSV